MTSVHEEGQDRYTYIYRGGIMRGYQLEILEEGRSSFRETFPPRFLFDA